MHVYGLSNAEDSENEGQDENMDIAILFSLYSLRPLITHLLHFNLVAYTLKFPTPF